MYFVVRPDGKYFLPKRWKMAVEEKLECNCHFKILNIFLNIGQVFRAQFLV